MKLAPEIMKFLTLKNADILLEMNWDLIHEKFAL